MIPDGLTFRRYRSGDREQVWRLHNQALEVVGAHRGNGPWDEDLKSIEDVYLGSGGEFLVGEYDGRVVAMGALRRVNPTTARIARMRVQPELQRRGIGRALLERLEARAMAEGVKRLQLDTTARQEAAQRLYESNGYEKVGEKHEGGFRVYEYRKDLR